MNLVQQHAPTPFRVVVVVDTTTTTTTRATGLGISAAKHKKEQFTTKHTKVTKKNTKKERHLKVGFAGLSPTRRVEAQAWVSC
jgi:hypothetical protein